MESYKPRRACNCRSLTHRYILAFLTFLGLLILSGMRCNLGFAVVKMTANMTSNGTKDDENDDKYLKPQFAWSSAIIGVVHSSYFWGSFVMQVPGGYFASRLPATKIFGVVIAASCLLNMLFPTAARVHFTFAMAVRIVQGLFEGCTYAGCIGIWSYWAPPLERSVLGSISFAGAYGGAVVGMPLSGYLTKNYGWSAPFYVFGVMGVSWAIIWWFLTADTPRKHPCISEHERTHIETSIGYVTDTSKKPPWTKMLTSLPVMAIAVANICTNWTFFLLIIEQPKYFFQVFNLNLSQSGFLTALPYLILTMVAPLGGFLADSLRKRKILSTTVVRKMFNCGGFGMEAVFLLVVGFTNSATTAVICLTLAVGFSGFAVSGFNVNPLDIAPRFASILMGISNAAGCLSAIVCAIVAEALTKDKTPDGWRHVFILASCIHFAGVVFYAVFASGDIQPWAETPPEDERKLEDVLEMNTSVPTYGSLSK